MAQTPPYPTAPVNSRVKPSIFRHGNSSLMTNRMTPEKMEDPKTYIDSTLARMRISKILVRFQLLAVIACWACIALSIWLKFTGGRSSAIIFIAGLGGILGAGSYVLGRFIDKSRDRFNEIKIALEVADGRAAPIARDVGSARKVPLTVGFANLIGESMTPVVIDDVREISGLFLKSVAPPVHQIPSAEILFVYANLGADGTISPDGKSGIRQIIELTSAEIVVVASPNSSESVQKAIGLPGPKTANIIFTLSRNGRQFGDFFGGLFEKMREGKDMLSAWAELAPQVPAGASISGPQTLLFAERGKIVFPHVDNTA